MLIELPTTTEFFAQIGAWSSAMFNELKPVVFLIAGLTLGVAFGILILRLASWVFEKIKGGD
jgi:hypothetical protein